MEDRIITFLNCNESFKKSIPRFIEAFVKFYGEELRPEIEEKFSKATFIGYQKPDSPAMGLRDLEQLKTKELIDNVIKQTGTSLTAEDIIGKYSFEYQNLHPIYEYFILRESFLLKKEGRRERFKKEGFERISSMLPRMTQEEYEEMFITKEIPEKFQNVPQWLKNNLLYYINEDNIESNYQKEFEQAQSFLRKIDKTITIENMEEKLESEQFTDINKICDGYKKSIEEYEKYKEQFAPLYEELKENEEIKTKKEHKFFVEFIKENIDLIPEDKKEGLDEYFVDKDNTYKVNPYVFYIFSHSLFGQTGIESFSKEKEEELQNSDREWIVSEIKRQRITFFNKNGINLGNSYEDYEKSEEARKIWPSQERVDEFLKSKEKYINQFNNEYYTSLKSFKNIRKEVDEKNLLDKDDSVNASLFVKGGTFVSPNLKRKENYNGYDLSPLVLINFDDYDNDAIDHYIVHELNHLFELTLLGVYSDTYDYICGWDRLTGEITKEEKKEVDTLTEKPKRPYELFNEIINELIAQEIGKIMHENNMYVFDNPQNSKTTHTTSYEHSLFLVKDFFNEFKDKIIESRRNGNIEAIFQEVGKENFDELNSLFEIYFENFSGFKIYNLISSLKNKEDNEMTRIYYDLVDRKNKIMDKMRMVSVQQKQESYNV